MLQTKISKEPPRPAFVVKDISSWPEDGETDIKPDLAIYPTDAASKAIYERDIDKTKIQDEARVPHAARAAWHR